MLDAQQSSSTITLDSIDDTLGPSASRFFGEGFKRSQHLLSGVVVTTDPDGGGSVTATASVRYPTDWSRKSNHDQRPHLSTVDVLVIGAELADLRLARAGLAAGQRRACLLHGATIRAGRAPVEDDLRAFDVAARFSAPRPTSPGLVRSSVSATVGTLSIVLDIEHPQLPSEESGSNAASVAASVVADFRGRRQRIENVTVDDAELTARADVLLEKPDALTEPVVSPGSSLSIDAFVVGLQLGQVLLYRLDGLERGHSNTLWMRRTVIRDERPGRVRHRKETAAVGLLNRKLMTNARSEQWRTADIVGTFQGITISCSIAHRLPSQPSEE